MAEFLRPGTPCLVRAATSVGGQHNGKLVIVRGFVRKYSGYDCKPVLRDYDDSHLIWSRKSLIPLGNSDAPDEMLRITGKPETAARC